MFKVMFLSVLVARLDPGHQLLVAVASIELLGERAYSNTAHVRGREAGEYFSHEWCALYQNTHKTRECTHTHFY